MESKMNDLRTAVVGVGATGTVLAAALLSRDPETILVVPRRSTRDKILQEGLRVSGLLSYEVQARHVVASVSELKARRPDAIFLCSKTFSLPQVLDELKPAFAPGMKIVSAQNGLGPEDVIAERFGADAALRMSLNYGAALKAPGEAEVAAVVGKPNPLGVVSEASRGAAVKIAELLTAGGLDTEFVDDIRLHIWKKMVMKCTMASICAVTKRTVKSAIECPPTREIAVTCFKEVLAVAKAMGYDLGEDYLGEVLAYLERMGTHRDSMCQDIAARRPTEIDFLGGKVVEYAREKGVPAPAYTVMTNLVKALQDSYLNPRSGEHS